MSGRKYLNTASVIVILGGRLGTVPQGGFKYSFCYCYSGENIIGVPFEDVFKYSFCYCYSMLYLFTTMLVADLNTASVIVIPLQFPRFHFLTFEPTIENKYIIIILPGV